MDNRRSVISKLAALLGFVGIAKSAPILTAHTEPLIVAPPTFWYENKAGDRWIPGSDHFIDGGGVPDGFEYQWSSQPCCLHDSCCTTKGPVMSGSSGWSEDLVMAMANRGYRLSDAIMIAAHSCERCMNSLAFKFGLKWGYERGSAEWKHSNTSCDMCLPKYSSPDGDGILRNLEANREVS